MSDWDADRLRVSIARDLREISSLYVDLWAEAMSAHADREMPGGDAMNMLGPAANLEAWQHRYEVAEAQAMNEFGDVPGYLHDQVDTDTHPLLVLASWEDAIREECDQPTDLKATVPRAVDYLRGKLDWMTRTDPYGDPEWIACESLLADLQRVRNALERVLHDGIRTDRGADCPDCHVPLVHVWTGNHSDPKTIEDDFWRCTRCETLRPYRVYLKLVEDEHLNRATWLQADHIELKYRIPTGTLHGWASKGYVAKKRNIHTGRMVYRVLDAIQRRDRIEEEAA